MPALLKKRKKEKLPARQRGNSCLNCNVPLDGNENFCPGCGQRNNINQLNFRLFVDEFFGDIFSYDSRLWSTVTPLILRPGKVAYEFVSGKRKQFVNPFRTYLTISLIFFLIFGLLSKINELRNVESNITTPNILTFNETKKDSLSLKEADSITKATLEKAQKNINMNLDSTLKVNNVNNDSLSNVNTEIDSLKNNVTNKSPFFKKLNIFYDHYKENKEQPVAEALDSLGYENTFWNRFYYDKAKDSRTMMKDKGENFNKKIFSSLSLTIFLFLPIFTLFLKLIYLRRKYTYIEHMVFVFYTQSVFFLLLLLFFIIHFFSNGKDGIILIALLLFSIYLLIAMKTFYKQGWFKTIMKYLIANFAFTIIAIFGLTILTFVSFIFY